MRCVLELRSEPQAVVITGDLAEHAAAPEYDRVRELLEPLSMPVHLRAGNHDDRDALRASFGPAGCTGPLGQPFQYTARCGDLRLVVCDTTRPGRDDGQLDAERRAWLESQLVAEPEAPTVVAMHHPPLLTGIRPLDDIGLPDADRLALAGLLARSPQVRRVVAGHVHRAVFGVLGGCGVVACPSTYLQARLEIAGDALAFVSEPPAFALHVAFGGDLVSHVQPIRDREPV